MKAEYLFYFCDGMGSVFDSQVLSFLEGINEKKIFKKIYLFLGVRDVSQKIELLNRGVTDELETIFFKSYPNYPFFNYLIRSSIRRVLRESITELNTAIIHTRGEMIAWHLSNILGKAYYKNIIPDVRGSSVEELEQFYDINRALKRLKVRNNKNALKKLNRFDKISVVSESLMEYLINNYQVDPGKIVTNPSLAGKDFTFNEELRKKVRSELNLNEKDILIVFSSGGIAGWQNNDVISRLAKKGLKVLNLSKKEILHENVINMFVSYDEMPSYLNAADIAIIWRDVSIVNKVASPVKFSEYVCCGLPVIANHSVDLIAEYINKYECGIIVDSTEVIDLNMLKKLRSMNRKKISENGIKNFGIETIINKYIQIYSSFNN